MAAFDTFEKRCLIDALSSTDNNEEKFNFITADGQPFIATTIENPDFESSTEQKLDLQMIALELWTIQNNSFSHVHM